MPTRMGVQCFFPHYPPPLLSFSQCGRIQPAIHDTARSAEHFLLLFGRALLRRWRPTETYGAANGTIHFSLL